MSTEEALVYALKVSEAEAAKTLTSVAAKAKEAKSSLDQTQQSFTKVESAGDRFGAAMGKATGKIAAIGSALQLIDPRIAAVANGLVETSSAMSAVGVAAGSFLAVAAPVAIALGVLALAYRHLSKEAEEATKKQEAAAKAATAMQAATGTLAQKQELAELGAKVARGELPESALRQKQTEIQAEADFSDVRTAIMDRLNAALSAQAEAESRIAASRAQINEINDKGYLSERGRQQQADDYNQVIEEQTARSREAAAAISATRAELESLNSKQSEHAKNLLDSGVKATRAASEGESAHAKAMRGSAQAAADAEAAERLLYSRRTEARVEAAAAAEAAQRAENDQLRAQLYADADRARDAQAQGRVDEEQKAIAAAASSSFAGIMGSDVTQAGIGLASGQLSSVLALAGPYGIAASALMGLGQAGGANGVRSSLEGQADSLVRGIEDLPEIIGEVLPDIAKQLAETLPQAIIEALPQIAAASLEAQFTIAKYILTELPGVLLDAFTAAMQELGEWLVDKVTPGGRESGGSDKTWWQKAGNTLIDIGRAGAFLATGGLSELAIYGADKLAGIKVPRFASGTDFVARTGLAVVHQGEKITSKGGARLATSGGGEVHFHISGYVGPDSLVALDRTYREWQGLGLTYGG